MVVRSVLGLGINDGNIVITTMYGSKVITNGKRSHMEKIKQLWNWAVQKFIELKTAINELFDKGLNLVMDFYEIVPSVRVNTEIRLI